jgi:autotransporter-associated beta strand protein
VLLNGANTFTGPIGIGNGTLEIGGAGLLNGGSYGGTIQVASGSTFKYNSSANQTLTAAISGAGALVKDGVGSLTVQGTNVFTGGTTVNGGKLILQSGNDTSANLGSLVINSGGTVEVLGVNPLWNGTSPDRIITINGGTLTRTSGGNGNQDYRVKSIEMTAGLISSTSVGYMEFFNDAYGLSVPVNTYASSSEAVISANWGARNNGGTTTFVFTTADGTTASGVDLLFSGNLAANSVYNVTKAGAGVMAISANYHTTTAYAAPLAGYSGTTTISGGTLQLGNGGAAGTLNPLSTIVDNGTLAFNRDATSNLVQGTHFNSVISGTGGVSQLGVGTTILSGVNTYTGATLVSNGTLLVSGSISGSAVTVSGTGTLGGSGGTVGSVTVTSGGTLAPGASTGILTSSGNLTMSSGSTFAAEVNATGVGTGYDQMIVAGNVNLGGSTLSLSGSTYNLGDTGDVFTLILNNGASAVTGTFSGLSNGSSVFFGGQEFQISYFDIASTGGFELSGGNDVSLMAVPEPGAAVSLLGGLGLLLGLRRRRRA